MRSLRSVVSSVVRRRGRGTARTGGLVILDDVFPNPLSAFRLTEFTTYLDTFPGSHVLSVPHGFPTPSGDIGFEHSLAAFAELYPRLTSRVTEQTPDQGLPDADLAYVVFINNGNAWIEALEAAAMPFVITIYPGGGMALDDPAADAKLERVLTSPLCRGVITTQRVTRDYLLAKGFTTADKVTHVFGVVPSPGTDRSRPSGSRTRYGRDRDRLEIVFAAHRYTAGGHDKGYDVVVDSMRRLLLETDDVDLHLVGPWELSPEDLSAFGDRVTRHGLLSPIELRDLYRHCDLVLSPNRPFVLYPGSYDGFPLGTCVEAGLEGVAVLATNALGEEAFVDGTDITIIEPTVESLVGHVLRLRERPDEMHRLGDNARASFTAAYSPETQLAPRIALVERELARAAASRRRG